MDCPRCKVALEDGERHGLPAKRCPKCEGSWLAPAVLEQLEDRAFPEDAVKGTRRYGSHESDLNCPHCAKKMIRFRYRANPLELEHCPDEAGYWLDRDEDKRIVELMRERASGLRRSAAAQRSWQRQRRGSSRGSIIDRIRDLFRGR